MKRRNIPYRRIYEKYNGTIADGYDIHHIDGNPNNNDPSNLKAVSEQEHYDIHWAQGDYAACLRIAARMKISRKELSRLSKLSQAKIVAEGRHIFTSEFAKKRNKKWREEGKQYWTSGYAAITKLIKNKTHPFFGGNIQRKSAQKRIEEGTHNLIVPYTCPKCGKVGKGPMMKRWHFENCKYDNR